MGYKIGNSGPDIRRGPAEDKTLSLYYTTNGKLCQ